MTLRRFFALLRWLPAESEFKAAMAGGVALTWANEMLAQMLEAMFAQMRIAMFAGGAKKHQVPRQPEIPRPWADLIHEGVQQQRRARGSRPETSEIAAALGAMGAIVEVTTIEAEEVSTNG